jgi:hypothetical protein
MNPTAIYSKSGKGVQEASGKTSLLDRGDRAVLSAIDGRANLGDVAKKVGKSFDSAFQTLITKLDKDGFIREASPGTAVAGAAAAKAPAGKPAAKPAGKSDDGGFGDLDFSSLGGGAPKAAPPPSRPAAPPPRPAAPPPPPPKPAAPKVDPGADAAAKAQQSALQKAREEAEAKADAERQRVKAEAEAKMRVEMEAQARDAATKKLKEEAEARIKAEADAKIRAAQEAAAKVAAEAKAKADAAREEAERARKAAEEEARRAREEAERVRKAAEEEARKAREEAERARKEAERARKEAEEAARKAREEAERKAKEEAEAMRRKHEEDRKREEAERRKAREEEDRRAEEERAAKRKQREEEDAAERREEEERAARRKREREEAEQQSEPAPKAKKKEEAPAKSESAGGLDSLLADLDSFTTREEADRKDTEEAERKAQETAARRAREDEEQRTKEEAERAKKEEARARKEEEKRRKKEEEEAFSRTRAVEEMRLHVEEEKRKKEADERERKAKQEEVLAAQANRGPAVAVGEDTDEVRKRMLGRAGGRPAAPAGIIEPPSLRRKKSGLGKLVAMIVVLLLIAAVGVVHIMPVPTGDYERAASEALGRPVKIGEARLSLMTGLEIRLKDIRLGDDVRIASGSATPEFETLRGERKIFSRIDLEGVQLPQEAIGQVLLAKVKADNFAVGRVVIHKLELTGAAVLPSPLEADLVYADDGSLRSATVRGPDTLLVRITPAANNIEYVLTASGFPLPILPELTLSDFAMKGTANARGMSIAEWGGKIYGGSISGTANLRWAGGWTIDGVVTVRNVNAAVFAPALLSEGKGEGTGRFSMSGTDPSKLASGGRLEGNFTVNSGAIGIDLGRVIRTGGRESAGRTAFNELTGQGTYDRGAVSLRNISIGSGVLNAGASADVAQSGALTGRIIVDVKSTSGGRAANATLQLGGTIKEPQVKN